ncbi:MAG: hypothetical protein ACOC3Z_02185 [Nanoarchaeota archaeon]
MSECNHKRIKKNYPFGKKSKPVKFCKDCGIVITGKMTEKRRKK